MAKNLIDVFTLAQHQGRRDDPRLANAVELAHVTTCEPGAGDPAVRAVVDHGGVLLPCPHDDSGMNVTPEMLAMEQHENWPPGIEIDFPCAPGSFNTRLPIRGQPLYVRIQNQDARDALWTVWLTKDMSLIRQIVRNAIDFWEVEDA